MKADGLVRVTYFGAPIGYSVCQCYFRIFYGLSGFTYPGTPHKIWRVPPLLPENFFPLFLTLVIPVCWSKKMKS